MGGESLEKDIRGWRPEGRSEVSEAVGYLPGGSPTGDPSPRPAMCRYRLRPALADLRARITLSLATSLILHTGGSLYACAWSATADGISPLLPG